jgi:hypothetical protein
MALGEELVKKLSKKFEPDTLVTMRYKRYDLSVKTDAEGNAVLLFMGKADEKGQVRGDRYARTLLYDSNGKVVKDHWERKGKAF